jgi:hypothetical protein
MLSGSLCVLAHTQPAASVAGALATVVNSKPEPKLEIVGSHDVEPSDKLCRNRIESQDAGQSRQFIGFVSTSTPWTVTLAPRAFQNRRSNHAWLVPRLRSAVLASALQLRHVYISTIVEPPTCKGVAFQRFAIGCDMLGLCDLVRNHRLGAVAQRVVALTVCTATPIRKSVASVCQFKKKATDLCRARRPCL